MSYRRHRPQEEDQDERLPHGMVCIGYDADEQVYSFRDADGSIWEGPPGSRYGRMTKVSGPRRSAPPRASPVQSPPSASSPTQDSNAAFDDILPSYSRECQPGHRTLLSRLRSSARSIISPVPEDRAISSHTFERERDRDEQPTDGRSNQRLQRRNTWRGEATKLLSTIKRSQTKTPEEEKRSELDRKPLPDIPRRTTM